MVVIEKITHEMFFKLFYGFIMIGFGGSILNRFIEYFYLPICPRVFELGETVFDNISFTDIIKGMNFVFRLEVVS